MCIVTNLFECKLIKILYEELTAQLLGSYPERTK